MRVFVSSVMGETWRERNACRELLPEFGHTPILKANYETGSTKELTVYHDEPTADLIQSCDIFLMILRHLYGITTAGGCSMAHEELLLAQKTRKQGLAFGAPAQMLRKADKAQRQLQEQQKAYLGPAFRTYDKPSDFKDLLRTMLAEGIESFCAPLRPNRVFLSHSSLDKGFVERLRHDLLREGIDDWYDKVHLVPGDSLVRTIMQGVQDSAFVVLVLSPDSVSSDWVRTEIELALDLEERWGQKILIPVKCRDFDWPSNLEHLSDLKYADFTGQWGVGLRELLIALKE